MPRLASCTSSNNSYIVIATSGAVCNRLRGVVVISTLPSHVHDPRFFTLVVIFIASILLYPVIWVYNDVNTPVLTLRIHTHIWNIKVKALISVRAKRGLSYSSRKYEPNNEYRVERTPPPPPPTILWGTKTLTSESAF